MKNNKIIKSDLNNNWFIFLMATVALIILIWITSEAPYYRWFQAYPELLNFLSVLGFILLILLIVSLAVYLLINNWYRDKHQNLISEVKHQKHYHYYRVGYASLAALYFIIIAVGTLMIVTSATWAEFLNWLLTLETIVILLNIYLLGLVLFYLVKYAILYNFKLKWTIITSLVLLILSMLVTLYVMININFLTAIWTTMLSFIFFWKLNAFELSNYKEVKKWPYFELVMILITIAIAVFGFNLSASHQVDEVNNTKNQEKIEAYEYEYSVDFIATEESEFGQVTITKDPKMGYTINIDGDYSVTANNHAGSYSMTITNPKTNEHVNLQLPSDPSQPFAYYDVLIITDENSDTLNYKQCSGNIELVATEREAMLTELLSQTCITKEKADNLQPLFDYLFSILDKYPSSISDAESAVTKK